MPLTDEQRAWYLHQIRRLDPDEATVAIEADGDQLRYAEEIRCDESRLRAADPEELVRAVFLCLLVSEEYRYTRESLYIERYFRHGHPSSMRDEVDLIIYDDDDLAYALWEMKAHDDWEARQDEYIRFQLYGTAPLVGTPSLLVYATVPPAGETPAPRLITIDRSLFPTYESWVEAGREHLPTFPAAFQAPEHAPFTNAGDRDLRVDATLAEYRSIAASFHSEFFAEHPDNALFVNLLKCMLAKVYDERQTRRDDAYQFQVRFHRGREESAGEVFSRVASLYRQAYGRYIDTEAEEPDEISEREFAPERVKVVVRTLQGMALTRGAALHNDIIGAFFEEILRSGFKQDKGMYFTHANLVYFILEALDLDGLAASTWSSATHPSNRLPYVIDPSCGAGTFLLRAMDLISRAIVARRDSLVVDQDAEEFFAARMSEAKPHYWAEAFLYGMDPKFVMALTSKLNMVLHGDGSAHMYKSDALKPLSEFRDDKLRPMGEGARAIPVAAYEHACSESFDVVVSNPPFGITLSGETKAAIPANYSLKESSPSEALFIERWFQLLKAGGRLGVVLPESIFNAVELVEARLLLYRFFRIKAIVSMPRNLFIDTPTLTSLLFAQKKTAEELAEWDQAWAEAEGAANAHIEAAETVLRTWRRRNLDAAAIRESVMDSLRQLVGEASVIPKKGKAPMPVLPADGLAATAVATHFKALMKLSGFKVMVRNGIFAATVESVDYEFPAYIVDEVGYKLSKRGEKPRPNQLCRFEDDEGEEVSNLHLARGAVSVQVSGEAPERVLDFIRRDVSW